MSVFGNLSTGMVVFTAGLFLLGLFVAAVGYALCRRNMHLWLGPFYVHSRSRASRLDGDRPVDVFLAICDHYEPEWGKPCQDVSLERVNRWCRDYPRLFSQFQDENGRPPQHTFFFPQDEYAPEYLDRLRELCAAGFGDVDIHLHHDHDTPQGFRDKLESFRDTLYHRHGLLRRDPMTDEIIYGFIHGNWALCNSRPDGRWCGVAEEIPILTETGCYADFTMPSAPSDTQTHMINSIYYARNQPGRIKSHDSGILSAVGKLPPKDSLLMIQGPLRPDWNRRKWGILPRIENGDLHGGRVANWQRFQDWVRTGIHVAGRPDWIFVKVHTHGCKEANTADLLGEPMVEFHRTLAERRKQFPNLRLHYVTAWEMAQLVHQAESGSTRPELGTPGVSRGTPQVLTY